MFDIGFSELMVIGVVALVVIGPERLPKVARTMGHVFGRLQRYVTQVKSDISREMELDELRKLQSNVEDAARAIQGSVENEVNETRSELDKVAQEANPNPAPDHPGLPVAPAPAQAPEETAPGPGAQQLDLALEGSAPPPQKQT